MAAPKLKTALVGAARLPPKHLLLSSTLAFSNWAYTLHVFVCAKATDPTPLDSIVLVIKSRCGVHVLYDNYYSPFPPR